MQYCVNTIIRDCEKYGFRSLQILFVHNHTNPYSIMTFKSSNPHFSTISFRIVDTDLYLHKDCALVKNIDKIECIINKHDIYVGLANSINVITTMNMYKNMKHNEKIFIVK